MRKLVLIALLGVLCWWYFIGGRTLSAAHVERFYQDLEVATLSRDPRALCSLLDNDFESSGTVVIDGHNTPTSRQDKSQACEAYDSMYDNFAKLGEKMGGILYLESRYEIKSIEISPDGKRATVDYVSSLDVGGSLMSLRSRSTDTLVRRNGKTLLLRSEGRGAIRSRS